MVRIPTKRPWQTSKLHWSTAGGDRDRSLEDRILHIVRTVKRLDERFDATTPFAEVGLDSLARVRILVAIDQQLGVWVEAEALPPENLRDVACLAACVEGYPDAVGDCGPVF